jgi:hypothetical protein
MMTRDLVLREALEQFVSNLNDYVESQGSEATTEDTEKLRVAEEMLDWENAKFLNGLDVAATVMPY